MDFLLWIVLGALAGWIASMIMRSDNSSILGDIVLGILGAVVGGLIMNLVGQPGVTGFNIYSIVIAVFGSAVLIWLGRAMYRTR